MSSVINISESLQKTIAFEQRVLADGGTLASRNCTVNSIPYTILRANPKLVITPSAIKEGKLYSILPNTALGDITVVRATDGTYVDSDGLIKTALPNVPRLDYSGGVTCPAILVEPQRTNLFLRSEEFDNAYWQKVNSTITANSIAAPDGSLTADALTDNATLAGHGLVRGNIWNTNQQNASIFVKANTLNKFYISNGSTGASVCFDLTTGTIEGQHIGTANPFINAKIEAFSNGWFRISGTHTALLGQTFLIGTYKVFNPISRALTGTYVGTGESLYIWGAQVEQGATATSYIPTVASTVTRNADVISKTGVSDLIGQTEGTVYVEVDLRFNTLGVEQAVFELSDGSNANRIILSKSVSGNDFAFVITKASSGFVVRTNNIETTGKYKIAIRYNLTSISIFVNTVKYEFTYTSSSFTNPVSRIDIGGRRLGSGQWNGGIESIIIIDSFKSDAELIALTTL